MAGGGELEGKVAKLEISPDMMGIVLESVEFGFKQCERGNNLEMALLTARNIFEIENGVHDANSLSRAIFGETK